MTNTAYVAITNEKEQWVASARCRGMDPNLFFPTRGVDVHDARSVCRPCPVRMECLEYAVVNNIHFGMWGGRSERERNRGKGRLRILTELHNWRIRQAETVAEI